MGYIVWFIKLGLTAIRNGLRRLGRAPDYIEFTIDEPMLELEPIKQSLLDRFFTKKRPTLKGLIEDIRAVLRDPRVKGIVVHSREIAMPITHVQSIRDLFDEIRASGKRVIVWSSSYSFGTYYLASAADEVLLQTGGAISPLGLRLGFMYMADGLRRAGIEADVVQISGYKSAGDALSRSHMSKEAKEMTSWLMDSLFRQVVEGISKGRRLDPGSIEALIDRSPFTDMEALEVGLVDKLVEEEDLPAHLGGNKNARVRSWSSAKRSLLTDYPVRPGKHVALVRIEGSIVDGKSGRPPFNPPVNLPFLGERAGDLTIVQAVRKAAASKRAAAVVLFVDSGGGSATSSEAMAAALSKLAEKKPLVVSMGTVAASGGYYVAMPGGYVFAQPGTITGSIGVLSGKIVTTGAFEKASLNRESLKMGARADMNHSDDKFTKDEREIVWKHINRTYDVFVDRVTKSRHKTREEVDAVGKGRVWTGEQALHHGLIDEVGDLDQAIAKARQLGGLGSRAPVRVVKAGKRPVAPAAARPAASFMEWAIEAVEMFNKSNALCLTPLTWDSRGGGVWI